MNENDLPIGYVIAQTAKILSRNFSDVLVEAGGSLPNWLVLLALSAKGWMMQSELADQVGVQGPTLTHHLNAMESQGLITRTRLPSDRRAHRVALTPVGKKHFETQKHAAMKFDNKLSASLTTQEMTRLRTSLKKLLEVANPQT